MNFFLYLRAQKFCFFLIIIFYFLFTTWIISKSIYCIDKNGCFLSYCDFGMLQKTEKLRFDENKCLKIQNISLN